MPLIDIYQNYIFIVMWLIFAAFIAMIAINIRTLAKPFRKIRKKTWLYLLIIFLTGLILRLFVFPHVHLMFIDEPWYMDMAKNMDNGNGPVVCNLVDDYARECSLPLKPSGWPFLVSIIFLFGVKNYYAIYLNSIIGSLSVILIFLLTYLLFRKQDTGLWSALFLALTPIQVIWSNTAETNNASVFFILLTMLFFFAYIDSRKKSMLTLTMLGLIFSILTRFENIVLAGLFILCYLIYSRVFSRKPSGQVFEAFYPFIVAAFLLCMVFFESVFIKTFRSASLSTDLYYLNIFGFLRAVSFDYIYLLLAAGAFFLAGKKDQNRNAFLATGFISFFVIYLPIFSEDRMALVPMVFLIMLASGFMSRVCRNIKYRSLSVLLIVVFLGLFYAGLASSYDYVQIRYRENILETQVINELKDTIPSGCYLIAEWPVVFTSVSDIKGISTSIALDDPGLVTSLINKSCVLYLYDGYCVVRTISRPLGSQERCSEMLSRFNTKIIKKYNYSGSWYYLYELAGAQAH